MGCPGGGAAVGGKALGATQEDFPGGEGVLAPSLVMTGGGNACLGGDVVVATWLTDFATNWGCVYSLKGTALAACYLVITTLFIFISPSSGNILCFFIS